jgi:predicted N-acyltransferase
VSADDPRFRSAPLSDERAEPYTLRILGRVRDVPQATWDALVDEDSSPFVEWEWLDMLEETGCVGEGTGWIPAHLSLWRNETLVAVAPAYVKGHSEGFVFDWSWADAAGRMGARYYPKILVAVPFTPATGDRVLVAPGEDRGQMTQLLAQAARSFSEQAGAGGVHILFPRADEAERWLGAGYLLREGFQFHWFRQGAQTFDDYLSRFTSKQRNQIRRELRGVREAGLRVETLSAEAHTHALAQTMHGFYASTIEKHGMWGRMYLNAEFFDAVVERWRHRLAWVTATDASGRLVAGAFNVWRGRRLYGRYWGAEVEVPHLHFVVCYYEGIRHAIERGIDVFEPGAGGEHKRARGFLPTLTRSVHWLADARLRAALRPWLERERARVRALCEAPDDAREA